MWFGSWAGIWIVMSQPVDDALAAVRTTADRVVRFTAMVEADPADDLARTLWRGALEDLRGAIQRARALGATTVAVQQATGGAPSGRFEAAGRSLGVSESQAAEPV